MKIFHLKYLISTCALLLLYLTAGAQQYQNILHKPYHEKATAITELYADLVSIGDSLTIFQKANEIKEYAIDADDKELAMEMDLFTMYYITAFEFKKETSDRTIARMKQVIATADYEGIYHIKIRAMRVLADYYWHIIKNYELAFEQYMLISIALRDVSEYDYPDMAEEYLNGANAYYSFDELDSTKAYLNRVIKLKETPFNTRFVSSAKNTLALCFRKEGDWAKSDYYFKEVLKTPFEKTRQTWDPIIQGNLGINYYLRGEYDKPIPLLLYHAEVAIDSGDFESAGLAHIILADIYLKKNQSGLSWQYLGIARTDIAKSANPDNLRKYFPVLSKWYMVNHQSELAAIYVDSSIIANNAYNQKYNTIKVLRALQKIAAQEHEIKMGELLLAGEEKTNQRNLLMILVATSGVITLAVYKVQRKKQQLKDLQLASASRDLQVATQNLNLFTQSISEKNQLIEQLEQHQSEEEKNELIHQLQQSTILTDDDWKTFQEVFDRAYPGFITRVKETYSNLSLGEVRFFVLTKLKLSYKEMASMMGVSPNTVHVIRHRVRKKMCFEDNQQMEQVIASI